MFTLCQIHVKHQKRAQSKQEEKEEKEVGEEEAEAKEEADEKEKKTEREEEAEAFSYLVVCGLLVGFYLFYFHRFRAQTVQDQLKETPDSGLFRSDTDTDTQQTQDQDKVVPKYHGDDLKEKYTTPSIYTIFMAQCGLFFIQASTLGSSINVQHVFAKPEYHGDYLEKKGMQPLSITQFLWRNVGQLSLYRPLRWALQSMFGLFFQNLNTMVIT